jgi:hypothetical protein
MANVIKMLLSLRVLNIFSKTPFFHYLQNLQKPTAMFDVLKKKKQISTLTLPMYCGLHFLFRRAHYYHS